MKILWLSWKNLSDERAGGAEKQTMLNMEALADHHTVHHFSRKTVKNVSIANPNIKFIQKGGPLSVYLYGLIYAILHRSRYDLIVEEINTVPFFAWPFMRRKTVVLFYQTCGVVWDFQASKYIAFIGKFFERIYLHIYREAIVLTESDCTKFDLCNYGFQPKNIFVFDICVNDIIVEEIPRHTNHSTLLRNDYCLIASSARKMKRVDRGIGAYFLACEMGLKLKLILAISGSDAERSHIEEIVKKSRYADNVELLISPSTQVRNQLMRDAQFMIVTSSKEGWGLTVTEASMLGTPSVAFSVLGLKSSIIDQKTGILTKEDDQALAKVILDLSRDRKLLHSLSKNARAHAERYKHIHFKKKFLASFSRAVALLPSIDNDCLETD